VDKAKRKTRRTKLLNPNLPAVDNVPETTMTIRLPVALKESLKGTAESRKLNLSDYVRARLTGDSLPNRRPLKRQVSHIERDVLVELNRIGINLNQAVRKLNTHNDSSFADRQMLTDLLGVIGRIELALTSEDGK